MALSDYIPENRGTLSDQLDGIFGFLPLLVYEDGRPFSGRVKSIRLTDPLEIYDTEGRRLLPVKQYPREGENPADFLIEPKRID